MSSKLVIFDLPVRIVHKAQHTFILEQVLDTYGMLNHAAVSLLPHL